MEKSHWRLWFLKPQLLANDRVYHGSMKCGWNILVRDLNNKQEKSTDLVKKGIIEPPTADSVDKNFFFSLQLMYNSSQRIIIIKDWTELKLRDEFVYSLTLIKINRQFLHSLHEKKSLVIFVPFRALQVNANDSMHRPGPTPPILKSRQVKSNCFLTKQTVCQVFYSIL